MKSLLSGVLLLLTGCCVLVACNPSAKPSAAVRIRWSNDPGSLDPLVSATPQATEVINLLHCSLLMGEPDQQQVIPWLADSLPRIRQRGPLTLLQYRLRPQATWDNGTPVLARDVAFTLRLLNCPGLPTEFSRTQYGDILDVELDASDPRRFTLVRASSSLDMVLASGDFAILPEYSLDPTGQLRAVPLPLLRTDTAAATRQYPTIRAFAARYRQAHVGQHPERLPGCGPYKVAAWQPNQYLRLQRKARWWADRLAQPAYWLQAQAAKLEYRIIPDDATATLALRRGNLDLYSMPSVRIFTQLKTSADSSHFSFATADTYESTMVGFNTERAFLADARTRRALTLLFDVPRLIQATQPGLAYRSPSIISPRDRHAFNDSLTVDRFSPEQAVNLLQQAGWRRKADGTWWKGQTGPLALSLSYRSQATDHETAALQFLEAATKLGIAVRLRPTEASLLQQQLTAGSVDMFIRTISGTPFGYNFMPILHSQGIGLFNFTRFSSPESDQLIEAISAASQPAERNQLVRRFQRLLQQEAPITVLYFSRNRLVASRRLQPVRATSVRPGYDALHLKLATSSAR
ncbi:ABC transporter substrate-binding protein [Hymenobacter canadensis]|uniref:ABC transporter substrate-binding protein n=1 Tax=Hymenobacter canadensis TaxID=2999067 RepID=A0ABY7LJ04_9BACT|nr:ABC transporter substrate-binding protein [Hymenobacter canadensis]WBA40431.1 ABC transporter substrate-binding protein [Hymenobacter canadensis]